MGYNANKPTRVGVWLIMDTGQSIEAILQVDYDRDVALRHRIEEEQSDEPYYPPEMVIGGYVGTADKKVMQAYITELCLHHRKYATLSDRVWQDNLRRLYESMQEHYSGYSSAITEQSIDHARLMEWFIDCDWNYPPTTYVLPFKINLEVLRHCFRTCRDCKKPYIVPEPDGIQEESNVCPVCLANKYKLYKVTYDIAYPVDGSDKYEREYCEYYRYAKSKDDAILLGRSKDEYNGQTTDSNGIVSTFVSIVKVASLPENETAVIV